MGFFFGGQLTKTTIKYLGSVGHTSLAHILTIIALVLQSKIKRSWAMWLALALRWIGDNRFTAVKAAGADLAKATSLAASASLQ